MMAPAVLLLLLLQLLLISVMSPAAGKAVPGSNSQRPETTSDIIQRVNKNAQNEKLKGQDDIMLNTQGVPAECTAAEDGCKWPKKGRHVPVEYVISNQFSRQEINQIKGVMKFMEETTCIRFRPAKKNTKDYIEIISAGGCWSYVGRIGGKQQLSLGLGCLVAYIVEHELMHALGFHHEHVREDRDDYVTVNHDNILEGYEGNFVKRTTNNLGTSYNLHSVMHYGRYAFSKNGDPTIEPHDPNVDIGGAPMGALDIARINTLYACEPQ